MANAICWDHMALSFGLMATGTRIQNRECNARLPRVWQQPKRMLADSSLDGFA